DRSRRLQGDRHPAPGAGLRSRPALRAAPVSRRRTDGARRALAAAGSPGGVIGVARNGSRRATPDAVLDRPGDMTDEPLPSTPEEAEAVLREMVEAFSVDAAVVSAGILARESGRERVPAGPHAGPAAILTTPPPALL